MKKQINLILIFLVFLISGFAFQKQISQFIQKEIDIFELTKYSCNSPNEITSDNITSTTFSVSWKDVNLKEWEYFVQLEGVGLPDSTKSTKTTNKSVTISMDFNNNVLIPNTAYEIFIRGKCSDGSYSEWSNPLVVTTNCSAIASYPFSESFSNTSTTKDCWRIIDKNNDAEFNNNIWVIKNDEVTFNGSSKSNDDYLISPTFTLDGSIYVLTYYSKNNTSNTNPEYEVLLSKEGIDPESFKQIIAQKKLYNNTIYQKRTYYITGITGEINLAWYLNDSPTSKKISIKEITLTKADCIGIIPETVEIQEVSKNSITVNWDDPNNTSWEFYIQNKGLPTPVASGYKTNNPTINVSSLNGGGSLQPDTEYEFYIRTNCNGSKYSSWEGPFLVKTPCSELALPFVEGFNTDSTTKNCWTIVNSNLSYTDQTTWVNRETPEAYEGDAFMIYNSPFGQTHDDWLISPTIGTLISTKNYKLSYRYKTNLYDDNKFEVMLSTNGIALKSFNHVLLPLKSYKTLDKWIEETILLTGINGNINIAWHALDGDGSILRLDYIRVEEILDCVQPTNIKTIDIQSSQATISWEDNINKNSSWEYIVQETGASSPTTTGIPTTNQQVTIKIDNLNEPLKSNTEYEFFIRTKCDNNTYSDWAGPFMFITNCRIFSPTFKESFENKSLTLNCWNVIDYKDNIFPLYMHPSLGKNDVWAVSNGGYNGKAAQIYGYQNTTKPSYLVSPTLKFDTGKIYRLKYKIKSEHTSSITNNLEILASNKGIDKSHFTTIIMPLRTYSNSTYQEEIHFISNLSGNINIAWYSPSHEINGTRKINIDDVSIEEVQNCPEPIKLDVKNIETDQVELFWSDDQGGTKWEYYIQSQYNGVPSKNGILTTHKNNIVTKDNNGNNLVHNTTYEYYVRTICKDETYSIWAGPFVFTTSCGIFETPFWEGFNKDSASLRCWTTINSNNTPSNWLPNSDKIEGNQSYMSNYNNPKLDDIDDWLISPTINLDGSDYVLKFFFKAIDKLYWGTWVLAEYDNNVEISLSNKGTGTLSNFDQILLPKTNLISSDWQEKAILIQGVKGDINLAWRMLSKGKTSFNIDHVRIEKVHNCIDPINIKAIVTSPTSFDLSWTQLDASTQWEVIVVPYGRGVTYPPVQSFIVNTLPSTPLIGLSQGTAYTIYVRTICNNKEFSNWSEAYNIQTEVGLNNLCDGAINIPVNQDLECSKYTSVSFKGATLSSLPLSNCHPYAGYNSGDIWFSFIAQASTHTLSILDIDTTLDESYFEFGLTIYDTTCNNINSNTPTTCAVVNNDPSDYKGNHTVLENLVIGNQYLIRIRTKNAETDHKFNICITTPLGIQTSPSGELYSTEDLINKVFINSSCQLASNISYQNGDGSLESEAFNTFGYFNSNNTIFPFKEGIVLSTNEVSYVPGPYRGYLGKRGDNNIRWNGDKDINDAIEDAGGGTRKDKRVTQVEFDFISVKDSISFEYLFASNSYHKTCGDACSVGALFAAWLIDTTTGEGQNLAKIEGTNTPIALNTIRDAKKSGIPCDSSAPEWYWKHYDNNQDNPIEAPIDFVGFTKPMKSETIKIIPGRKYHIKLAVMDFCPTLEHSSAVFFNAASFDLGKIDLGANWTTEAQTALCANESRLLKSGVGNSDELKSEIQWYKDGELIVGENKPDLLVTASGKYKIKVNFIEIECESEGEIDIEMYPDIKDIVPAPQPIYVCRYSLDPVTIILNNSSIQMITNIDKQYIIQGIYETQLDAENIVSPIEDKTPYNLGEKPESRSFYVRVENTITSCHAIYELKVITQEGAQPIRPEDIKVCQSYTLPQLDENQKYFTQPDGKGIRYQPGDVLDPGVHTLYIVQQNQDSCYEQTSFTVFITTQPELQHIADQVLECEFFVLPELLPNNKYYIEKEGQRIEVMPQTTIYEDNTTIFIVMESDDKVCYEETSFTIKYNDCPIPKGFSPNGDGINDRFDLSLHNVSSLKVFNRLGTEVYTFKGVYLDQWDGKNKKGKMLPSGTYYYVVVSFNKTRTGWVELNY